MGNPMAAMDPMMGGMMAPQNPMAGNTDSSAEAKKEAGKYAFPCLTF